MDWLKQMNDALAYLEENLDGEIDLSVAAQKACCSVYHFQRIFSYMAEVPAVGIYSQKALIVRCFRFTEHR